MEAKETKEKEIYLGQFIWAKQEVMDLDREIQIRRQDNLCPASVSFDRDFVTGSRDSGQSIQVRNLNLIMEMELEQAVRRQLCLNLEQQIRESISQMPEHAFRRILTKRYLLGLKLPAIAREIGYSTSRTCELAKQALEAFTMPVDPIWM